MKIKRKTILFLALALVAAGIAGALMLPAVLKTDLSGKPYSEISQYITEHPRKTVTFHVDILGGNTPLTVDQDTDTVTLTHDTQLASLMEQAALLPPDLHIRLDFGADHRQLAELAETFPLAQLSFSSFSIGGKVYDESITELDLAGVASTDVSTILQLMGRLPKLTDVYLMDENGSSALTLDDALRLQEAAPEARMHYSFQLFGQTVSTDMTELYYKNTDIGDEGLEQFRRIMPMMKDLTYLQLDTCKTTDEATAQLRDELKGRCKVVWRVFFGKNDALTDTYKILATWNLDDSEAALLKYFTEAKYVDLGHNPFTNVDFLNYMPDVEMLILALDRLTDLSGIANCTKLEFLEIFSNTGLEDEDMVHLSGLTNLKYLNMSNLPKLTNLSFTDNLNLRWLYVTMSYIDQSEIDRVQQLHPDWKVVYRYGAGNPTGYGWRYLGADKSVKNDVYKLVCARFKYEGWDESCDGKGYLREEITFESLGLTPP